MRPRHCVLLVLLGLYSGVVWAAFPGLRYLGDIGDLGISGNSRTYVQFGRIQVVWADNAVRFQGRDDDGKSWQAILPIAQGLGYTDVWQADFDHNSRADLLIAAYFPKNGRCVDEVTLSFLLFNDRGQPVPWVIRTRAPYSHRSIHFPAIFADVNHSGRAKLIVTDCTYSDPPLVAEDRSITGIYEAADATWRLVRPARLEPYITLVRRNHRFRLGLDQLLTPNPADWPDQGNRLDSQASASVNLAAILPASTSCRGVRLPPIINGRFQRDWKDPCDELGRDRVQMSNGTVCYGLATVVFDGQDGREIVAPSEHPEALLQKFIEQRRPVVLAGQRELNKCSPVLLWATATP
jgi:hypothetical protein